jgi:hypothetical protein
MMMAAPSEQLREEQPWFEYRRLVLNELERLTDSQNVMSGKLDTLRIEFQTRIGLIREEDIGKMRIEIAMLKVKAGTWGAIAGLIPGALAALWMLLKH